MGATFIKPITLLPPEWDPFLKKLDANSALHCNATEQDEVTRDFSSRYYHHKLDILEPKL
eukprot:snap_masked-scaffold_6-processed-gene-0.31-mRNA-1 protein AED:1.00 eAED:1.00 QI:0/0/0/0/1/1/2/0/59